MGALKHIFSSKKTRTQSVQTPSETLPLRGDWRIIMHKDELQKVWIAQPQYYWGSSSYYSGWQSQKPTNPLRPNNSKGITPFSHPDKDKAYAIALEWTQATKDDFTAQVDAARIAKETKEIHNV